MSAFSEWYDGEQNTFAVIWEVMNIYLYAGSLPIYAGGEYHIITVTCYGMIAVLC